MLGLKRFHSTSVAAQGISQVSRWRWSHAAPTTVSPLRTVTIACSAGKVARIRSKKERR